MELGPPRNLQRQKDISAKKDIFLSMIYLAVGAAIWPKLNFMLWTRYPSKLQNGASERRNRPKFQKTGLLCAFVILYNFYIFRQEK
jgi:hypothetical protein